MSERLQKLIAASGLASRRQAERMIAEGRVTVNGIVAQLGQSADPVHDAIAVDGDELTIGGEIRCLILNKPRGYVTTMHDEKGRHTVAELVSDVGTRVYPVGRLDMDSDGLLLLTNDGALANAVMHPSLEVDKTYRVRVRGDVPGALPLLRAPMVLDGHRIRPAKVTDLGDGLLEITIHEGRNRQIRRMCDAAGLRVVRLTRIAEGPLRLGDLPPGKWRDLTDEEMKELRKETGYERSDS